MKRKILMISTVMLLLGMAGCYKDVYYPDFDPNAPISFSSDVLPVLTKNCSQSGCHDAVPAHKPALTADKAFNAIKNGGYLNLNDPEASLLYTVMKGGSMPPSGALKSSDIQKVLIWIRSGAENN